MMIGDSEQREASGRTADRVYALLAAPFSESEVMVDTRGGVTFSYLTIEAVVSRLNSVLGPNGWSFRVLRHDINPEADEAWVLGELTAQIDGTEIVRQQFGSQKLRRARQNGVIMEIGSDLKGAGSDALKKCASLLGVGLYLSHKANPRYAQAQPQPPARYAPLAPQGGPSEPKPRSTQGPNMVDPNEVIDSLDHPVARRLLTLKQHAQTLGIQVPTYKLPATRAQLIRAGMALKAEVDKREPPTRVAQ